MSSDLLLPAELIDTLVMMSTAQLSAMPFGPALLLVRAPTDDAGLSALAQLADSVRGGTVQEPEAVHSTGEMPRISPISRQEQPDLDAVGLLAALDQKIHVVVPLPLREGGRLRLGRSPEAGIQILDASVSGEHAEFSLDGGALTVTDLGSKNGTRHNGNALVPGRREWLQPMDELTFGRIEGFLCEPRALRAFLLQARRTS